MVHALSNDLRKRVIEDVLGGLSCRGAATDMIPRYGRSLGGSCCEGAAPGGHWRSATFIAGLRMGAMTALWLCITQIVTPENARAFIRDDCLDISVLAN